MLHEIFKSNKEMQGCKDHEAKDERIITLRPWKPNKLKSCLKSSKKSYGFQLSHISDVFQTYDFQLHWYGLHFTASICLQVVREGVGYPPGTCPTFQLASRH